MYTCLCVYRVDTTKGHRVISTPTPPTSWIISCDMDLDLVYLRKTHSNDLYFLTSSVLNVCVHSSKLVKTKSEHKLNNLLTHLLVPFFC